MGKMSVYSLDYDGCMAGNSIDEIINTNEQLIAEIIARIEGGEEVSIYVGSNRQGIQGDILNSSRHGCPSVFAAYPALVDHIKEQLPDNLKEKIKFNNYLLADAQQGIVPGTNFDIYQQIPYVKNKSLPQSEDFEAIKRLKKEKKINDSIGDETKIPTLYAQMQQVASFNPSSKVEFIFKNDRKDLLDNLHLFYTQNPQLIPANITLKFEQKFSKQLQELLEEEKNKIINDSSLTSEQKNEQIERDVLGKRYQVFETKSIQGKAKEVDSNYGQTATAMLVIATQIATKKHEPEKKFSTPRQIYDNPKKAIGEILNYSYSLSEVFVEKDFSATFKRYLEVQEDALLEEKVSKRMNVLIDVHEEIHKNELTSDHEFQVFDGPIRHASLIKIGRRLKEFLDKLSNLKKVNMQVNI